MRPINIKEWIRKWLGVDQDIQELRMGISHIREYTRGLEPGTTFKAGSSLEWIAGSITAFETKLGRAVWHMEPDPRFLPEPPRVMRVWTLEKPKRKKK